MRFPLVSTLGAVALAIGPSLLAVDIEGVQMASMDQPRVTVMLRRTPNGNPLFAKGDAGMAQLMGLDKEASDKVTSFAAFLDTGASGVSISTQTADSLGIRRVTVNGAKPGNNIVFHDVGVGGTDQFNVSEPLCISVGAYQALGLSADEGSFRPVGGPWYTQIGPLGGGGLLGMMMGGIDVAGMPVMAGKIVVIDARPVNTFSDTLRVQLLEPRDATANRLPQTQRHVQLSYGDFAPYTTVEPAGATRPVTTANPFIGKAPVAPGSAIASRDLVFAFRGKTGKGAWLLDTGAAASMISTRQAATLGVRYKPGSDTSGMPELDGVAKDKQFTLTVGGIGGSKKSAGFFLDELRIPTAEGDDLVYKGAPVLVCDITVEHPQTHEKITLDGVFGMNFLVASASVSEGLSPDIGKTSEGAYDFIVIDHTRGILGLQLRKELRH